MLVLSAAAAKSRQSCLTLCDPIDGSPPGSPVPGILQARTLEWVAISFSNAAKWKVKVKSLNRVRLLATPWTAAYQAPPSMGFSRQEYLSGVPLPSPWYSLVYCINWHSYFYCTSVQSFSHVQLLVTPWTAAHQASLSISSTPKACSNSCPSSQWWHPNISSSVIPSSCPQSFPASGSFSMSQFFVSGGQNIGASASASVLPMNIQDCIPLGLTGLISLQPEGLSRVFSNTAL